MKVGTSPWRKASRSNSGGSQCVEARTHAGAFEVRDSKSPQLGTLAMTGTDFTALLDAARR